MFVSSLSSNVISSCRQRLVDLLPEENSLYGKILTVAKGIASGTAPHLMTVMPLYMANLAFLNIKYFNLTGNVILLTRFGLALSSAKTVEESLHILKQHGVLATVNAIAILKLLDSYVSFSANNRFILDLLLLSATLYTSSRSVASGLSTIQSSLGQSDKNTSQKIANLVSGTLSIIIGAVGLRSSCERALDLLENVRACRQIPSLADITPDLLSHPREKIISNSATWNLTTCPNTMAGTPDPENTSRVADCVNGPEETRNNYLCKSGYHSSISPVTGRRADELSMILNGVSKGDVVSDLQSVIYRSKNYEIIRRENAEDAVKISREMYSQFLDKYRKYGITEDNAVTWTQQPCERSGSAPVFGRLKELNEWHQQAMVCEGAVPVLTDNRYIIPDGVIAIHELMHLEERAPFAFNGREEMTVTKTLMLLDEINKKIQGLDIDKEVEYNPVLRFWNHTIPIGKYINFYRNLEKRKSNLAEAITSQESVNFLNG